VGATFRWAAIVLAAVSLPSCTRPQGDLAENTSHAGLGATVSSFDTDPYWQEIQRNSEQRSKTCEPGHLKVGMGWSEVTKLCPGSPDSRVVSTTALGESIVLMYKHYPGPTFVYTLNGKVTSVQMLEGN
jgi:hypothetical protein